MEIVLHNIRMSRLKEDDIELLRTWRNSESVNRKMIFRKQISAEDQLHWFRSLDSACDFYFMVNYKAEKIGLMNIKNIKWGIGEGEPGGFIANDNYLGTYVPAICLIGLFDFAFYTLKLKVLRGKVLVNNQDSIKMNMELGGIIESEDNEIYTITHTELNYRLAAIRYKKAIDVIK